MNKKIIIGIIMTLMITISVVSVSAWSFKPIKFNGFKAIAIPFEPTRHVISISNPSKYNETDLIRFAEMGIDIHNWVTWYGGKMTAYRNPDGTYYLSEEQKSLIKTLYSKGQRIFWIGVTSDHINFLWENPYDESANMIKAYVKFFSEEHLRFAKVGLYVPVWHDEIITRKRPDMTWQEQYDLVETSRIEILSRLSLFEQSKIKWTVTGQDYMVHDGQEFQLTNDKISYWAHHTDVTEVEEAEDLVYHHILTVMADSIWKEKWSHFKKFAWTDGTLVDGDVGERQLTELGKVIFE